jgi:acid phosphatase type 7
LPELFDFHQKKKQQQQARKRMKSLTVFFVVVALFATLSTAQWSREATIDWMQKVGDANQNGVLEAQDLLALWHRIERAGKYAQTLVPHPLGHNDKYIQHSIDHVKANEEEGEEEEEEEEEEEPNLQVCEKIISLYDVNGDGALSLDEMPGYEDEEDVRHHWKYHKYNSTLPQQVHLSMVANQTGALAVIWQTLEQNSGAYVQYSNVDPAASAAVALSNTSAAVQYSYSTHNWLTGNYTGHLQRAILTGLEADTRYWYRVGNGTEVGWSQWFNFRSPVRSGEQTRSVRIAQAGDQGSYMPLGFKVTEAMAKYHAKKPLDLAILSGDTAYAGTSGSYQSKGEFEFLWDWWGRINQQVSAYVPWLATVGNHDLFFNATAFRHRFYNGGTQFGNFVFSYDVGPVHVLSIDTETTYAPNSPQYNFIAADLAAAARAASSTPWIVVSMHRPVYSSDKSEFGSHNGNPATSQLSASLEPLFNEHGVDVVLQGHMHSYSRTYPTALGAKVVDTSSHEYTNPGAPIYATVGTAGIFLDYKFEHTAWAAKQFSQWGFAVLEASTVELKYEWHNALDHLVQDHFTISKKQ